MRNMLKSLKLRFFGWVNNVSEPSVVTSQDEKVDNFSRLIASQLPRREILKMLAAGLTIPAFGKLQPAFAASPVSMATACCNGVQFDTSTQCCTSTGPKKKNPIEILAACPDKLARPGFSPTANGCGPASGSIAPYIPDSWGPANFLTCCNGHDVCWGTCNNSRDNCDLNFLNCNRNKCDIYLLQDDYRLYQTCRDTVSPLYYTGVHADILGGGAAYVSAQKEACQCCSSPNPTPDIPCPGTTTCCPSGRECCGEGRCCPEGQKCVNGACCPTERACNGACCAADQTCVNGVCSSCPLNRVVCNGVCCPPGYSCGNGTCICNYAVCCPTNNWKETAVCRDYQACCPPRRDDDFDCYTPGVTKCCYAQDNRVYTCPVGKTCGGTSRGVCV